MLKCIVTVMSFFLMVGCTTAKISIYSSPEKAKVYAKEIGKSQMTLIGETPLFIDNYKVQNKNGAGPIYFEIQKEGFKTDSFYVTEVSKVDIAITRELEPKRDYKEQAFLNGIIDRLFDVRRMVESKKYTEALRVLDQLKLEAPQLATIYEMQGGILLLKQNYKGALEAYRQAYKFNPTNPESLKMVRYIEKTFGYSPEYDYTNKPDSIRFPAAVDVEKSMPEKEVSDE